MIKTDDWDDRKLRNTLLLGHIYLRYCEFKRHPIKVLKWFIKKLKNPKDFIGYIKRVITD